MNCRSRVISGHLQCTSPCPLYPRKQTLQSRFDNSVENVWKFKECLVVPRGVEPPTFGLGSRCSILWAHYTAHYFPIDLCTRLRRPHSAIEPGLRLVSPANGHYAENGWRLSAQWAEGLSSLVPRDPTPRARSPLPAGFLATLNGRSLKTGLVGWGGRNRTSEWRNQNPLPYRLATPQCFACAWSFPKTGYHFSGSCAPEQAAPKHEFARAARTIAATACPINARTSLLYGISAAFSGLR